MGPTGYPPSPFPFSTGLLASLCCLPQGDFPLKADRVVQSVKAICNALAAVETPEITSALNQLPPCPSRMKPKIQKVMGHRVLAWGRRGVAPGTRWRGVC